MIFKNRNQAGTLLSEKLQFLAGSAAHVLGLARGGVVVAQALAEKLNLPLDVLVVKKLASPYSSEFAIGAVAPDSVLVVHWPDAHRLGVDEDYVNGQLKHLAKEINQKMVLYRKGRKPLEVKDKAVVVVDDGAATGATIEAAVQWLKKKKAKKIIVALPVAPPETVTKLKPEVDEMVVLHTPADLSAVGQFYEEFGQVADEEVAKLLQSDKSDLQ